MNDQFSLQIIENVKAVIDKNYPDLKGAKLNIEIAKQVDKFTDAFPGDFDQDAKDFLIKKVMRRLKKTMEVYLLIIQNSLPGLKIEKEISKIFIGMTTRLIFCLNLDGH